MRHFTVIFLFLLGLCCCTHTTEKSNPDGSSLSVSSTDTFDINHVQWKKLGLYIWYYALHEPEKGNDTLFTVETLGIFTDEGQKFTPAKEDTLLEMGYTELTDFLMDKTLFSQKAEVDYLIKVNSELFYFHQPWLLYTILVSPADKEPGTALAIRNALEAKPYVEKVELDSMESDVLDTLSNDFRRKVYFRVILKDKKVNMQQAHGFANDMRNIKGVDHADFNTIYAGESRTYPVYRVRSKKN